MLSPDAFSGSKYAIIAFAAGAFGSWGFAQTLLGELASFPQPLAGFGGHFAAGKIWEGRKGEGERREGEERGGRSL